MPLPGISMQKGSDNVQSADAGERREAFEVAPLRRRGADLLRSRGTARNGTVQAALDFLLGFFGGLAVSECASA